MSFFNDISAIQNIIYIFSSILFISGIKMLGKEDTAVKGNFLSAMAMFIAVSVTIINVVNPIIVIIGSVSFDYLLSPVISGSVIIIIFAIIVNKFIFKKSYPR